MKGAKMPVEFATYKVGEKVTVKFLVPTVCDGRDVEPGDVVETSKGNALEAIYCKKAVAYVPEPEVVLEVEEVKPKGKKGK